MRPKKNYTVSIIAAVVLLISGCGIFDGGGIVDSGSQGSAVTNSMQGHDFDAMRTYAVFSGRNFEYLKECVENGVVDVNKLIPSDEGTHQEVSPLFLAVAPMRAEYLLQKGADPNVAFGDTTLLTWWTGEGGSDDTTLGELYIRYGADVNARNADGHSALYNAVKFGRTDYVKLLLENGAEITQDDIGMMEFSVNTFFTERTTDEQEVSRWDHETNAFYTIPALICEAAEKQGPEADASLTDSMIQAVLNNDPDVVIAEVTSGGISDVVSYLAAAYCKPDVMDYLASLGLDTGAVREDGMTLLWMAAAAGNIETVQYLVENGVSMNHSDYENERGYSEYHPLISAIKNNRIDIVRYLLKNGFGFNMELEQGLDDKRHNAMGKMIVATAASGNPEFIPLLMEHGYEMDGNIGYYGLRYSIIEQENTVLEALLDFGIDPDYGTDQFLFTILEECASDGSLEALVILNRYGLDLTTGNTDALNYAAEYGKYEVMKYLLDEGMPVDACYRWGTKEEGFHAIFSAVNCGYFDKVKLLVERGADVNDPVEAPLVRAAGTSRNITEYLLDAGANANLQEAGGRTALMMAAANNNVINVQILLDAGADKTLKDVEGKTAYDYAKENDAKDAMQMLERSRV